MRPEQETLGRRLTPKTNTQCWLGEGIFSPGGSRLLSRSRVGGQGHPEGIGKMEL